MDEHAYGYHLPPDISAHGPQIDHLLLFIHLFMLAIFAGWLSFFIYCLFKFRMRHDHRATYQLPRAAFVKYAELSLVFVELLLLFGVSTPIWWKYREGKDSPDAVHLRVVAEQYAWSFHYPGADGKFGRASVDAMSGDNPLGLDADDPAGKDDVTTINQMHIPVGRPVVLELSSKDVIHAFNIPVLRVKHDLIPGQAVTLWFTATQTGHYEIACAQLCGLGHYRMRGDLFVDSPADYAKWLRDSAPGSR